MPTVRSLTIFGAWNSNANYLRRAITLGLCLCVSVCVTTFSVTTRNKPAKKRQQRVQRYIGFIFKMADFVKAKVMA